ncbi:MAG: 5-methyltetrahydropteroyltriglutamate--homocysteine methyltransferase, partial [Planctomycetes bacterium]|nr:5-methyltetrahydropteroyltriglutamate--homocysteine methyltransferase [Planctomycetota bacterium]
NDLDLFDKFKRITVVLGAVSVVKTKVELVEDIRARACAVVERVGDPDRVWLAPDCGGAMLPIKIFLEKIDNMCEAACL